MINEDSNSEQEEQALIAEMLTNAFKDSKKIDNQKTKVSTPENEDDYSVENEKDTELEEIIVSTNSNRKESITSIEDVIDRQKIFDFKSKNFGEVLEQLSGVSSYKMGNSIVKPVINGLHSNRVEIINNGVRMEDQQWGVEHAPNIDINSLDKITLIKGAGDLQYTGRDLGEIILRKSEKVFILMKKK